MVIGERLRALREQKGLSLGDIEKRSGLRRPYISRVEHGHTVPSIDSLERMARALEVPLHEVFYEGKGRPKPLHLRECQQGGDRLGPHGQRGACAEQVPQAARQLGRMGSPPADLCGPENGPTQASTFSLVETSRRRVSRLKHWEVLFGSCWPRASESETFGSLLR